MIRESDIQWWVLEATKHPESAPTIIEKLARRLVELDTENERLRDELIRVRQRAPAPRKSTKVETLQRKVQTLQGILERQESTDASLILFSEQLQAVRVPLAQVLDLVASRQAVLDARAMLTLQSVVWVKPGDELLILTSQGRGIRRLPADIPALGARKRWPAAPEDGLAPGERPATVVASAQPPRFWTVATRRAYVQRFVRAGWDHQMIQGEPLLKSTLRNDESVAITSGDGGDLFVVTRWGRAVRFSQRAIETHGSIALDLEADDQVIGAMTLATDTEILIVTASGQCIRRTSSQVPRRSRPGGAGKAMIQAHDVQGILNPTIATHRAQLLFLSYSGKLTTVSAEDVPLLERLGKGTRLVDLSHDPAVAVTIIP